MIADRILKRPIDALRREIRARLLENGAAEPRPDPLSLIGSVWSGSGADNMILIAGLARAGRAKRYLEIGAYRGFTAGFVRWACPDIEIHAIDNWQRSATSAAELVAGVRQISGTSHNVFTHEGDSTAQLDKLIGLGLSFDLIYVDGCHTYEYAKSDYEKALQLLPPTGTIVIDDTVTWWGPRELSEELQERLPQDQFHLLEIQTTNGLLILRKQPREKAPLQLTRENCPDGVWHDSPPAPSSIDHVS
jgi:predicted O-methyltransferase YrrM